MLTSSIRRPVQFGLLAVTLLTIAWGALAFGSVYPWAYAPLAIAAAVIGACSLIVGPHGKPPLGALSLGFAAIGAAMSLQLIPLPPSLLARISPNTSSFLSQYEIGYGVALHALSLSSAQTTLGLGLFAAFALWLLGLTRLLSARSGQALVRPLLLFGALLALFGIVQYAVSGGLTYQLKIYGFWTPRYRATPFGPFVNRNHFAGWMIMVLPVSLAAAYAAWEQGRGGASEMGYRERLLWLSSPMAADMLLTSFAAIVMGLSLLMSQSRSGMAGFAAGTLIFTGIVMRRQASTRARAVSAAVAAVVLLAAVLWTGVDLVTGRASSVQRDISTAGGRMGAWADTLRIVADFPVAGTGLNTYGTAMVLYQTGDRALHFQEAHNDYLQLASEGGLLVGVPILVTLALFARSVRQRFREAPKTGTTYWLRIGAVVGLVSIGLQSLVEFSLQMPGNAALFAALGALALHQSPNLRTAGDQSGVRAHRVRVQSETN